MVAQAEYYVTPAEVHDTTILCSPMHLLTKGELAAACVSKSLQHRGVVRKEALEEKSNMEDYQYLVPEPPWNTSLYTFSCCIKEGQEFVHISPVASMEYMFT